MNPHFEAWLIGPYDDCVYDHDGQRDDVHFS